MTLQGHLYFYFRREDQDQNPSTYHCPRRTTQLSNNLELICLNITFLSKLIYEPPSFVSISSTCMMNMCVVCIPVCERECTPKYMESLEEDVWYLALSL